MKMINPFSTEYRAGLKVKSLLIHLSTQHRINNKLARLIIKIVSEKVEVQFWENKNYIAPISIKSIPEFFGGEYDELIIVKVDAYLRELALKYEAVLTELNVTFYDNDGEIGAHVFVGKKFKATIPTLELLSKFYVPKKD